MYYTIYLIYGKSFKATNLEIPHYMNVSKKIKMSLLERLLTIFVHVIVYY